MAKNPDWITTNDPYAYNYRPTYLVAGSYTRDGIFNYRKILAPSETIRAVPVGPDESRFEEEGLDE